MSEKSELDCSFLCRDPSLLRRRNEAACGEVRYLLLDVLRGGLRCPRDLGRQFHLSLRLLNFVNLGIQSQSLNSKGQAEAEKGNRNRG